MLGTNESFELCKFEKIGIIGSNGMLGNYLTKYFKNICVPINRQHYDIMVDDITKLEEIIKKNGITVVINCSGIIKQKNAVFKEFIIVNAMFPHKLAKMCEENNIKCIHITTDCVFNGTKGNYTESDVHTETDLYGISKSLGEPLNCTVIRTSIIGEEINNKLSLIEWIKSSRGKTVNGYINHIWNGVTCLQLCHIINMIIKKFLYWHGVRHIYSPNKVSKYDIVKCVNDIYNLEISINKLKTVSIDKSLKSNYCIMREICSNIPLIQEQIFEQSKFNIY